MGVIAKLLESVDLVVVAGPDEGSRFRLEPPGPIPVGRSARGVQLRDTLVSIHHAEITVRKDGVWLIKDLDSQTGTRIGGLTIPPGEERAIRLGDSVEVGETTLVVERRHQRALLGGASLALVAGSMVVAALFALSLGPSDGRSAWTWHEPIRQGNHVHPELSLSRPFLRQHALDPARLKIKRVTDLDRNGVDEVWLSGATEMFVVTFDAEGRWRQLGRLPQGCTDAVRTGEKIGLGFPPLRCPTREYEFLDGQYVVSRQHGAVVWFLEEEGGRVGVGMAPVARPERVAGFLGLRGVSEAVSWVLCEDAFPELPAQVGTESGQVRALGRPCGQGVTLRHEEPAETEAPASPDADLTAGTGAKERRVLGVAFTHAGREGLLGALRRFYGGNTEGSLFLSPEDAAALEQWEVEPHRAQGRLLFHATEQFFQPFAREGASSGELMLHHTDEIAPSPPVLTATLLSAGTARVDPPGCANLELQTGDWTCQISGGCVGMLTFLTVRDLGCEGGSTVLTLPYDGGEAEATLPGLEVRARVRSSTGKDGLEVRQAQVSYRVVAED